MCCLLVGYVGLLHAIPLFFSSLPLHVKVLNYEIIFVGVIGVIVGTVVAVMDIVSSVHFVPPCYVNLTAASLANQA